MSREIRFSPEEKEQVVVYYIQRDKSTTEICKELGHYQEPFEIKLQYIINMEVQVLKGKHEIVLILKNLKLKLLRNISKVRAISLFG